MELGPEDVSLLERYPHFRGWYVQVSMELGPEDVSLLKRCPHFRGWYVQALTHTNARVQEVCPGLPRTVLRYPRISYASIDMYPLLSSPCNETIHRYMKCQHTKVVFPGTRTHQGGVSSQPEALLGHLIGVCVCAHAKSAGTTIVAFS